MKNKKKTILGIVLLSIVTAWFAGCDKKEDIYYPITITIFTRQNHPQPSGDNKIYKYLTDNLNVTFHWDILVGDAGERQSMMIAGGNYPDMIEITDAAFIEAGALIPLESLIEQYAPGIKEHFGVDWDKMKWEDGNVYSLVNNGIFRGRNHDPEYSGPAMFIQRDVLREAGYPRVVTLDQYFDLILNYARRHPVIYSRPVIPFAVHICETQAFNLWSPPKFLAGNPGAGNGIVNPVTRMYRTFFTMEISKRWFQRLNEMNSQGFIDRAGLTDTFDQYLEKISQGRVLGVQDHFMQINEINKTLTDADRHYRTMVPLPIVFDSSIRPRWRDVPIPNFERGVGISVSARDPVRIIRFMEQFLDEKVQRTMEWGIQGEDWQYDDRGVPYRTSQQRENWGSIVWQRQNRALLLRDVFPKWEGEFSGGYPSNLGYFFPEREEITKAEDRNFWASFGALSMAELMDPNPPRNDLWHPVWNLPDPPDGSPAQIALQRSEQTMRQMLPRIILAPPAQFERLWEEYLQEMNVNNIGVYEQYRQEQINERIRQRSR